MQLQWSQFKNQVSDRGGDKDGWPFLVYMIVLNVLQPHLPVQCDCSPSPSFPSPLLSFYPPFLPLPLPSPSLSFPSPPSLSFLFSLPSSFFFLSTFLSLCMSSFTSLPSPSHSR